MRRSRWYSSFTIIRHRYRHGNTIDIPINSCYYYIFFFFLAFKEEKEKGFLRHSNFKTPTTTKIKMDSQSPPQKTTTRRSLMKKIIYVLFVSNSLIKRTLPKLIAAAKRNFVLAVSKDGGQRNHIPVRIVDRLLRVSVAFTTSQSLFTSRTK
ncbi:MAG: hypothetical protein ACI90V_010483 [Bacillariaceae sp.]|jgi:hypothetical protein